MFLKLQIAALLVLAAGVSIASPTGTDGQLFPQRWRRKGTTLYRDTFNGASRPKHHHPHHHTMKLSFVLSVADHLYDRYAIFPNDAGNPSSGLGGVAIDWSSATGPELTIENDLPQGSYTVMLVSDSSATTTVTNLFVQEIPLNVDTTLTFSPDDLIQSHGVKVSDATGAVTTKSAGRLTIQSPFFADGWAHGFSFIADSSRVLNSNQVSSDWTVLYQARWETTSEGQPAAVIGLGQYAFDQAQSTVTIGDKGYSNIGLTPRLPTPADPYLHCLDLQLKLPSGLWLMTPSSTKATWLEVAKAPALAEATLDYTYTTNTFAPTNPDFACFGDVYSQAYVSTRLNFDSGNAPVLVSDTTGKTFYELPTVMRLANQGPAFVGNDLAGYRDQSDGTVEADLSLSDTNWQYSEFAYQKVNYELLSVDDNKVLAQGVSDDSGNGTKSLSVWLPPGNYSATRSFKGVAASDISSDTTLTFQIKPGGAAANKRLMPSFRRFSWRTCCGTAELYIEPAYDSSNPLSSLTVGIQVRQWGSTGAYKTVNVTLPSATPDVYQGTFPAGLGTFEVLVTVTNSFGDTRVLHLTNMKGGGV